MAALANTGSGSPDETTVTTTNSAKGGDAWTSVVINTGATAVYDELAGGLTWLRFSTTTNGQSRVEWTQTAVPRSYGRVYIMLGTGTLGLHNFYAVRLRSGATQIARLSIGTGTKLQIRNTANSPTTSSVASIAENTAYRIEWDITSGAAADASVKLYLGEATTEIETLTATGANFGTGNIDLVDFGIMSSTLNHAAFWVNGFNSNDTAMPGRLVRQALTQSPTDTAAADDVLARALTAARSATDAAALLDGTEVEYVDDTPPDPPVASPSLGGRRGWLSRADAGTTYPYGATRGARR